MKPCMFCKELIHDEASVCPICRYVQTPTKGPEADKSAERVIALVDAIVRWLAIPLTVFIFFASFFGIAKLSDIWKAQAEVERASQVLKASEASLNLLLSRTIKLEAESLLEANSLDSEAREFLDRLDALQSLIAAWDRLQRDDTKRSTDKELNIARTLIMYKRSKTYKEMISILGDPPSPDGIRQRHLLAAAYKQVGDAKSAIKHNEKMVMLARNRGSLFERSRQNLAEKMALNGQTDEAIRIYKESLEKEDRAIGRANLAGLFAQKGNVEDAFKELGRAFDLGLCVSLESLDADPMTHGLVMRHRERVRALVAKRGTC